MLDPDIAAYQERLKALNLPPANRISPEEARANLAKRRSVDGPGEPVHSVEDRTIPGPAGDIPVRIYRPAQDEMLPGVVYFHGGGWVMGDLDINDPLCRVLANRLLAVIISVNYRHAPEHRFPAAFDYAFAVTAYVSQNAAAFRIDPARIAVAGSSAGGNLAAAAALAARDRSIHLAAQVLLYPTSGTNISPVKTTRCTRMLHRFVHRLLPRLPPPSSFTPNTTPFVAKGRLMPNDCTRAGCR